LILGEQQYFPWDTTSQSAKLLLTLKVWGAWFPGPPGYPYTVTANNRKTRCFIVCKKKHE